jgi:hypothetical protein
MITTELPLCACNCGQRVTKHGSTYRRGHHNRSESGRARMAAIGRSRTTHGLSGSPTYQAYHGMLERTTNTRHRYYRLWGKRGVGITPSWRGKGGFERFLRDVGEAPAGGWLALIDPDGNVGPGNVEWRVTPLATTKAEQEQREQHLAGITPPQD